MATASGEAAFFAACKTTLPHHLSTLSTAGDELLPLPELPLPSDVPHARPSLGTERLPLLKAAVEEEVAVFPICRPPRPPMPSRRSRGARWRWARTVRLWEVAVDLVDALNTLAGQSCSSTEVRKG